MQAVPRFLRATGTDADLGRARELRIDGHLAVARVSDVHAVHLALASERSDEAGG
ncbi:MAG: hypothetical protein ACLQDY_01985 [Streptosporangiaceae bacterium]